MALLLHKSTMVDERVRRNCQNHQVLRRSRNVDSDSRPGGLESHTYARTLKIFLRSLYSGIITKYECST